MKSNKLCRVLTGSGLSIAMLLGGLALSDFQAFAAEQSGSGVYKFKHLQTPMELDSYYTTLYVNEGDAVSTMAGDVIHKSSKPIRFLSVNPAGASFSIVTQDKKGKREMEIYSTSQADRRIKKFDVKTYGFPSAVAYSPDARQIAVATDKGICIFTARKKMEPITQITNVPLKQPTQMCFSPNGYFLAMAEGSNVIVYNYEEKLVRKKWDFEVPVTEILFSDDSSKFAVLSNDGLLSIFDTRTYDIVQTVDDLGEGIACAFNDTGKYVAVATSHNTVEVINLLRPAEREKIETGEGMNDLCFIKDSLGNTLLASGAANAINARRMYSLEPYYAKLVNEQVEAKMAEWAKMQAWETQETYAKRVNSESRAKQRRLFEDELSTMFAGDMIAMSAITLGKYNREKELLEVNFTNMPAIYLPVPKAEVASFTNGNDLQLSDMQYGLLPDDSFELIYAKVLNKANGKTYVYDNVNRVPMTFLDDDNTVSLEVLRQQAMEEMKLEEIRKNVVEEAKHNNVISDHTQIAVDSKVVPSYDANGNKILNYVVNFQYQVEPGFSAEEDFGPGKYHVSESGAASSMLKVVKEALEGDFAQYLKDGKKLNIVLYGTADSTPIRNGIAYDGSYGDFEDEPVRQNGQLSSITVTKAGGIKTNEQLAFIRAAAVKDFIENNVNGIRNMKHDYGYNIGVSQDKGSEFRRIKAEFTFVDAF